ncbi:MAG: hypothetical protein Q8Q49_05770 [bacterium]|nr:hypothetical protein [bacterium]
MSALLERGLETDPGLQRIRSFVKPDGTLFAFHFPHHAALGEDGALQPTTLVSEHLSHIGGDPETIAQVFSRDGRIIFVNKADFDINERSLEELGIFIEETVRIPMGLIDHAIRGQNGKSINKHGMSHAISVANKGALLEEQVGTPLWQRRAGTIAKRLHDIGNIGGRDPHPYYGRLIWRFFYPNLRMTEQQEDIINTSIMRHDGDGLIGWLIAQGEQTFPDALRTMREELGDPGLATVIGDKGDIGIDRLPEENTAEDLEDPHRIVNLYAETSVLQYTEDLETFYMQIDFGKSLSEQQLRMLPHFVVRREDGEIVRKVPRVLQNGVEEFGSSDFHEWEKVFLGTYYPRIALIVMGALALGDDVTKHVQIVITDKSTGSGMERVSGMRFDRDPQSHYYAPKNLYRIWQNLPPSLRNKRDYRYFAHLAETEASVI